MRAVVYEQFGEPADVLAVKDVPSPKPLPGEVRVRMLASPINPSDLMNIRGIYGKLPELPGTPGFEGVGVVESSGGGWYGKFLLGKRVAVLNRATGNWCEQTVIPAKQAIPLAADLPLEQAAMFFINPASAYVMTNRILLVPAGAWLLQTAAGSALGRMVMRLGKRCGFRTLNVVRREEQVDELKSLGGDAVLTFDPEKHDAAKLYDEVKRITKNQGVRYAIDAVGGATGSAVVSCLSEDGRLLVYGTLTPDPLTFPPRALITPGASIAGFWLARWMAHQGLLSKLRLVRQITKWIREGVLVSDVGESFPLERIADAVRTSEKVGRRGKVLLRIADL
jgi:NADPH2:quinone reductase